MATVSVIDDMAPLRDAIAALAGNDDDDAPLSRRTFDRARLTSALFARLEFDGRTACCDGASRWPDLAVEPAAPAAPPQGPAQPSAGRKSAWRETVCQSVEISGVAASIKKTHDHSKPLRKPTN